MSLQARFMVWAIVLLMVLLVSILLVIEQREVKAIFEEQKEKGVLIAKNIAYLNLPAFIQWDEEGVRENIEEQIDENLVYVVFYGRYNNLFVGTSFIEDYKETYLYSDLGEDVDEKSYLFERKKFVDENINAKTYYKIQEFLGKIPSLKHDIKYKNDMGEEKTITLRSLNDFFTF